MFFKLKRSARSLIGSILSNESAIYTVSIDKFSAMLYESKPKMTVYFEVFL